nr:MAG TPA: hypothetical protein [Caudoviricetes sp.]
MFSRTLMLAPFEGAVNGIRRVAYRTLVLDLVPT